MLSARAGVAQRRSLLCSVLDSAKGFGTLSLSRQHLQKGEDGTQSCELLPAVACVSSLALENPRTEVCHLLPTEESPKPLEEKRWELSNSQPLLHRALPGLGWERLAGGRSSPCSVSCGQQWMRSSRRLRSSPASPWREAAGSHFVVSTSWSISVQSLLNHSRPLPCCQQGLHTQGKERRFTALGDESFIAGRRLRATHLLPLHWEAPSPSSPSESLLITERQSHSSSKMFLLVAACKRCVQLRRSGGFDPSPLKNPHDPGGNAGQPH